MQLRCAVGDALRGACTVRAHHAQLHRERLAHRWRGRCHRGRRGSAQIDDRKENFRTILSQRDTAVVPKRQEYGSATRVARSGRTARAVFARLVAASEMDLICAALQVFCCAFRAATCLRTAVAAAGDIARATTTTAAGLIVRVVVIHDDDKFAARLEMARGKLRLEAARAVEPAACRRARHRARVSRDDPHVGALCAGALQAPVSLLEHTNPLLRAAQLLPQLRHEVHHLLDLRRPPSGFPLERRDVLGALPLLRGEP